MHVLNHCKLQNSFTIPRRINMCKPTIFHRKDVEIKILIMTYEVGNDNNKHIVEMMR